MARIAALLLTAGRSERFLGVDLVERAALTARRAGVECVHIVGAESPDAAVLERLRRRGLSVTVTTNTARPFCYAPQADLLLAWRVNTIVAPAALRELVREASLPSGCAALVVDSTAASFRFVKVSGGLVRTTLTDGTAASTALAMLSEGSVEMIRKAGSLPDALSRLASLGRLSAIERGSRFCVRLWAHTNRADLERAYLTHTSGGATEGVFTRSIRRWSVPLTRELLKWPITANQVTLAGLVLSAAAGWAFGQGSYLFGLVGAACYWVSMVLDCSDGEVARGRLSDSRFGAWFETVTDYLSYFFILAGIVWGDAKVEGFCKHVVAAIVAAAATVAIVGIVGYLRARVAAVNPGAFDDALAAELKSGTSVERLSAWGRQLIKRSFLAHLIVFQALIWQLPALTEIWAIGSVAALVLLVAVYTRILTTVRVEPAFVPSFTEN